MSILREVGRWVHANEAAIHGAGPTVFGQLAWGECTTRSNTLYLHVFQWPANRRLILPGLQTQVLTARLSSGEKVAFNSSSNGVTLTLPNQQPDWLIPVIAIELTGPPAASRDQYVLNDHRQTLEAGTARLKVARQTSVSWMEKFGDWKHADCLVGWRGRESSATWEFLTLEPGSFYLDVDYSCPAEDDYSEWYVSAADVGITFPLIDTGDRPKRSAFGGSLPRFRTYRIGVVEFKKPGPQRLTLGPLGSEGAGLKISGLILSPVH